jgi:hypothetical protein
MAEQIREAGHSPTCDDTTGRCRFRVSVGDASYEIQAWFSGESQTIYLFTNQLAMAPLTNAASPALLRYLAATNWSIRPARFEWNQTDGEIRLSTVQNVDTNFDRRAFRTLIRFLRDGIERFQPEITQIMATPDEAPAATAPTEENEGAISDRHGYMTAIQEELVGLGLTPVCDAQNGRCTYELDSTEAANVFGVTVRYDSRASVVSVSMDRYLVAPAENPRSERLIERAMELNWEQLVPFFQWNTVTNNVRLTGVMNTDSNFDRSAFRGTVRAVHAAGSRNYRAMRGMLNP